MLDLTTLPDFKYDIDYLRREQESWETEYRLWGTNGTVGKRDSGMTKRDLTFIQREIEKAEQQLSFAIVALRTAKENVAKRKANW